MNLSARMYFVIVFLMLSQIFSCAQALPLAKTSIADNKNLLLYNDKDTPPPREYFSLNTIYLGNRIAVNIGHDLINQNYVVMPSPNIQKVEKIGNKRRVTIQQYFPNLENKVLDLYSIPPNQLAYLYVNSYEIYDQDAVLIDRILLPNGTQFKPPQFYTVDITDNVKSLSFVYTFNGRTGWSDTGINTDLQGLYRQLANIGVDRDSSIHLEINAAAGFKAYEVLTSHETQEIQKILTEFHHIVAWGRIAQKDDLINKILDLKKFEEIDIDLAKGVECLEKYPLIFGNPLDPKWQSVITHISAERLTEKEMNTEGSISAKLGLKNFFSFGGSGSKKRNSRFKEMVKFDVQGSFYVPTSLHFATRTYESFELIKSLVFQVYDQLSEANFKLAALVSIDQEVPRVVSDRLSEGEELKRGESICSNNGKYTLVLQEDGNLVLYKVEEKLKKALWSSGTFNRAVNRCVMQQDGNLVIYGFSEAIWDTHTSGRPGAFIVMQDDGNLVMFYNKEAIWWTGTH